MRYPANVRWAKSSRSYDWKELKCVEVAVSGGEVFVRDSKKPASGALAVSPAAWQAFTRQVTRDA